MYPNVRLHVNKVLEDITNGIVDWRDIDTPSLQVCHFVDASQSYRTGRVVTQRELYYAEILVHIWKFDNSVRIQLEAESAILGYCIW